MKAYCYLPFFYFQNTRLNNTKAFVFHAAYEWLPAIVIAIYYLQELETLLDIWLYYLSFISIYEIGYVVNDQIAHVEPGARQRTTRLSIVQLVVFIGIRLLVFLIITGIQLQTYSEFWWGWYFLLVLQFTLHNTLKVTSLKTITFSYLAFARFFSPIVMLLPFAVISPLLLPVVLNYVIFRLFTYMDSKDMLVNFDRKSNSYYIGYYLLLFSFSTLLSYLFNTWVPLVFNLYYLLMAMGFTLIPAGMKAGSK